MGAGLPVLEVKVNWLQSVLPCRLLSRDWRGRREGGGQGGSDREVGRM